MTVESMSQTNHQERIGVYVCHCGTNIAGVVDVEEVARWAAEKLQRRGVIIARDYKFMCSSLGQELIENDIKELGLTRVVVAACSPHLHEQTFLHLLDPPGCRIDIEVAVAETPAGDAAPKRVKKVKEGLPMPRMPEDEETS